MVKVVYIDPDEQEHVVDVEEGSSLMFAAVSNSIPGIEGECGGACSCATCHVYIDPQWADSVGEPDETESAMLDFVDDRRETSRLGCQVSIDKRHEGLRVVISSSQG